uniref:Uncharacterized protein n=1 Tax=Alteromonadaceae bacterium PE-TB08W TaxID=1199097 RepID=A0A3G9DSH9_9ALTE|nr:hypothetical protein [Alteromonadaceae bacterium PE-TB08W]
MDSRDKQLRRHMFKRKYIAGGLPIATQERWARKCIQTARAQDRVLFFMLSSMWLNDIRTGV